MSTLHNLPALIPAIPDRTHKHQGAVSRAIRGLWWQSLRAYFALFQTITVEGRENLPVAPPFVLVANHQSHLDALLLAWALPAHLRRCVLPLAAGDTFFKTPAARLFFSAAMNALPLWRRHVGRHALGDLRQRLLSQPCGYILFPEGTRSRTGVMGRFRPGVGMLIAGTRVPVLPCHIAGTFEALPPQRSIPRQAHLQLRIGKALDFSHLPNHRDAWDEIATDLESTVRSLQPSP
jgi:1-acyl-sn-glycerol-3-phosphate acyltransferase